MIRDIRVATLVATWCVAVAGLTLVVGSASAQQETPPGLPAIALPAGPLLLDTAEAHVRLVVVTRGLSHPWGLAFLPDGRMLVTERARKPSLACRRCTRSGWPV